MEIVQKNPSELIPHPQNPRVHHAISKISNSIKEFGFVNPVIVQKGTNQIIAGHGRVEAAKKDGLGSIPVIELEISNVKAKALMIADNKTAEESKWNDDLLKDLFKDLLGQDIDLAVTGFDLKEVNFYTEENKPEEDDDVPEVPPEPRAKYGMLYVLGKHRLMCGDSTKIDDVEKLMGGNKADVVFADPPYNLGYDYNSYKDDKKYHEYKDFCAKWFNCCVVAGNGRVIITTGKQNLGMWYSIAKPRDVGIWIKKNGMSGGKISHLNLWEPIVFYGDIDRKSRANDLFEFNVAKQKDVGGHTCPKIISLIVDILESYSKNNDTVLDVFCGSGTTLIACEQTKRICYGMEIDPRYCDVIIERYCNYTKGNKDDIYDSAVQMVQETVGEQK